MTTSFPDGPEIVLPAGDVTEGVVRIGDTVRRPHQDTSDTAIAYLRHLEAAGFGRAPRFLGRDDRGRDVLTYLDGDVPGAPVEPWAAADGVLPGVARLLRALHDASEGFTLPPVEPVPGRPAPVFPAGEPVIVSQRDVTPQNTVFRDGEAWGIVDFDLSNRTTRPTDLANTAMHWVPLDDPADRAEVYADADIFARFRAMYDAYGRDLFDVDRLLTATRLRFAGSYDVMKWNADHLGGGWKRMWDDGLGGVITRRLAWFDTVRDDLRAALS